MAGSTESKDQQNAACGPREFEYLSLGASDQQPHELRLAGIAQGYVMIAEPPKPEKTYDKIRGHCPKCGPDRNAYIVAEYRDWSEDEITWYEGMHRILQCCGCETVFHQKSTSFSEDYDHVHNPQTGEYEIEYHETVTYWPAPAERRRPDWLTEWNIEDPTLYRILEETYKALDVDSRILAGIGIRTVFDRASEVLSVDPNLSFKQKLEALETAGKIGREERNDLEVLTDAGGAAAHRAWQPSPQAISTLMDTMESFIKRAIVMRSRIDQLKGRIPPRGSTPAGSKIPSAS